MTGREICGTPHFEGILMNGLAGANIAVTGASGGIGLAICAWLEQAGATTYALDLKPVDGQVGTFVACDVTDADSVERAVHLIADAGSIHGLVAGAGIAENDIAAEEMPIATFDQVMAVNLRGLFLTCQAFGRRMLDQGEGRIVAISSMSGNHIVNEPQRQCAYNASKAGVTALVKSLAVEWAPRGVRVNAVSPGYVDTPLNALKAHQHDFWKERTALGRFGSPHEVAAAVAYLLSDEAAFCCGTELLIDGGYSLR
jgi:NAD(P)-dependent dehydrogenase (short-subunit alcohol dehydrogenase family)